MTFHVNSLLGQTEGRGGGADGRFSEGGLGEKEGAW